MLVIDQRINVQDDAFGMLPACHVVMCPLLLHELVQRVQGFSGWVTAV